MAVELMMQVEDLVFELVFELAFELIWFLYITD